MKFTATIFIKDLFNIALDQTMYDARAANSAATGGGELKEIFRPMTFADMDIFEVELLSRARRVALKLHDRVSGFDHDNDDDTLRFNVETNKPELRENFTSLLADALKFGMLAWWWRLGGPNNLSMMYEKEFDSALGSLGSGLSGIVVARGSYF